MPSLFGRFVVLIGFILMLGSAATAQAATTSFYAAPNAIGAGDCSSPENACPVDVAVTDANAAPVTDDVRILLDKGKYALTSQTPNALAVTFAGPSLTFEGRNGTPTLSGTNTVRILSVAAGSTVTVDGVSFQDGQSTGLGGAIENAGTLTVKDSTFFGNTGSSGGAITNNAGGTLTAQDSTFAGNTTSSVGGGAIISFGTTTVIRSAVINNSGPINGGGINIQPNGTLTLSSSTVANNTSGTLGGGISNLGTLNVFSSTIADNTGSGGSAIATGNENVTLAASIIASLVPGSTCSPANASITDAGYNLDDDGTCISPSSPATGSHNGTTAYSSSTYGAVLDSYLADRLANNGGPSKTFALLNSPDPATDLADPAFDVVPPAFELPVAVEGETAACAHADQRGVMPAAGVNCDIGAYLLQATKIELSASASTVQQNKKVTYTATVIPAPDGGTVSFDDGAGNPATTGCADKYLANGVATCTVSYPNPGEYPVTASYTGDGAKNDFAASESIVPTNVTTTVTEKPVVGPPFRILGSTPNRRTGVNTVRVRIPAAGRVNLVGYKKLKSTSARFDAGGVYKFKANPKGAFLRNLNRRGHGRSLVKFKYIPDSGRSIAKSVVYPFFKKR
ncbi:MAG: Ig-like domain repeat protein [Solirubrobacterales bacterium]|nr:Ig-like domain repeat protein [Solirubrobacterales bacterium]